MREYLYIVIGAVCFCSVLISFSSKLKCRLIIGLTAKVACLCIILVPVVSVVSKLNRTDTVEQWEIKTDSETIQAVYIEHLLTTVFSISCSVLLEMNDGQITALSIVSADRISDRKIQQIKEYLIEIGYIDSNVNVGFSQAFDG